MSTKPKPSSIEDLLMAEALDHSRPTAAIRVELQGAGVDVDAILKRTRATIGVQVRAHIRSRATDEEHARTARLGAALSELALWPLERVQAWLKEVADGRHGGQFQALAQPCFRNRSAEQMSEVELRNLAAEIKATMESGDGR